MKCLSNKETILMMEAIPVYPSESNLHQIKKEAKLDRIWDKFIPYEAPLCLSDYNRYSYPNEKIKEEYIKELKKELLNKRGKK